MRLAVAAVAAAVATYFGGPQAGATVFSLVYGVTGFLDPAKKVKGPRLDDLKAPSAEYGAPIPYVEGAPRLAGCIIYASEKREIANVSEQPGKGGPDTKVTQFTYEIDLLVELAINRCEGIRRVWSNGKLIWSVTDEADDETIRASGGMLYDAVNKTMESGAILDWRAMRFYGGGPDQLPDPVYEAAVGIGNAPAYRGRTTVFLESVNLGSSGYVPVLTFEVASGVQDVVDEAIMTQVPQDRQHAMGTPAMNLSGFDLVQGKDFGSLTSPLYEVYRVGADGEATFQAHYPLPGHSSGLTATAAQGNSDESGMAVSYDGAGVYYWCYPNGASGDTRYDLTSAGGDTTGLTNNARFSRVGTSVVFGAPTGKIGNKLLRFTEGAVGPPAVIGAAMARGTKSVAIGGTAVYSLAYGGTEDEIYVLDLATLTLQDTLSTPVAGIEGHVICDEDGSLYYVHSGSGGEAWRWDGGVTWTKVIDGMGRAAGADGRGSFSLSNGTFMSFYFDGSSGPGTVYYSTVRLELVLPTLAEVTERLCTRTRQLDATDDLDVSALAGIEVRGFAITQLDKTRGALEMLMGAYLFEFVEGEKLRAVLRGGSSGMTIPYDDLAAGVDRASSEPLPRKRVNDQEMPAFITVRYANAANDWQNGAETGDRLVTTSTAAGIIELPIGFTPVEAKRLVDANTMDLAVALVQYGPINLPARKYAALEPTDVVTLTGPDGSTYRVRITKITVGAGVLACELLADDATAINSNAETDEDYISSHLVRIVADSNLRVMDLPPLRDADSGPGEYLAVGARGSWAGAEVDTSTDGITYVERAAVLKRSVVGVTTTVLPTWTGGNVFDEVSAVEVSVGVDSTLASSTRETMLGDIAANAALIGDELVQFRDAQLLGAGEYRLTGFLRARRGTEAYLGTHQATERFVLLDESALRRVVEGQADIGISKYWKAITYGKSRESAGTQFILYEGRGMKPFAPVDIRLTMTDGAKVTWNRRDRLLSRFLAEGTDAPMSEAREEYDFELRDGSAVLVDSGTVFEPEYPVTSLFGGQYLSSMWGMKAISSGWFAIRDDFTSVITTNQQLVQLDSDFAVVDQAASIGSGRITQYVTNDPDAYVLLDRFYPSYPGVPTVYLSTEVLRYTAGSLSSGPVATHTAATPGIYGGLCFDGSNVWVSEREAGGVTDLLRKLHPTTLASIATYNLTSGDYPQALFYRSGKIWVACGNGDVVRFSIAGTSEDLRFSVLADIGTPTDVFDNGTLLVVSGTSKIGAYDRTTGALLYIHDALTVTTEPQRYLAEHLGYVVMAVYSLNSDHPGYRVLLIDDTTGEGQFLRQPEDYLYAAAGSDGTSLYLTASPFTPQSARTRAYVLASPDLTNFSFTVWQKSAVVGRGYPGSKTFT